MDSYYPFDNWPSRVDYDDAMSRLAVTMLDAELREGQLEETPSGRLSWEREDKPICIYRICLPDGQCKMVRCFCRTENNQMPARFVCERYAALDRFSQNAHNLTRVSALLPISYHDKAINVTLYEKMQHGLRIRDTLLMPVVKMPFVEGHSLGDFVDDYFGEPQKMQRLSAAWLRMIREMEAVPMAHGDLDRTNVMVIEKGDDLLLKLIDYDNMWIPGFEQYTESEFGHKPFQDPRFFTKDRPYNAEMDRFSALVIYISLVALSIRPHWYDEYEVDEHRLLFSERDYQAEREGRDNAIGRLKALNITALDPYLRELCDALRDSRIPHSLSDIAEGRFIRPGAASPMLLPIPLTPANANNIPIVPSSFIQRVIAIDWGQEKQNTPPEEAAPMQPMPGHQAQAVRQKAQEQIVVSAPTQRARAAGHQEQPLLNTPGNAALSIEETIRTYTVFANASETPHTSREGVSDSRARIVGCLTLLTIVTTLILLLVFVFHVHL